MTNTDQREIAERAFQRNPKRDEINEALKQEHARREAAVKNRIACESCGWPEMQSQTTALNNRADKLAAKASKAIETEGGTRCRTNIDRRRKTASADKISDGTATGLPH